MFPRDNIRQTFTFMHNPVFEYSDTLSFALLACIILYINSKQFSCSVFTFIQYIQKDEFGVSRTRIKGNECIAVNDVCFLSLKMPHYVILVIYIHKQKRG